MVYQLLMTATHANTFGHMLLGILKAALVQELVHVLALILHHPFVGNDYYCESGTNQLMVDTLYGNDTLWDGQQCNHLESPCCTSPMMPWFVKPLNQSTTDDIELRMCNNEPYPDEGTAIDIVELYIR